ncbi:MAG: PaaI family thioesterase [Solirubrobacteraceae bacterium]
MAFELPYASERGFDALYGLEITDLTDELVTGRVNVRDELRQPAGLVHGGVYAAIAESLASLGTALAVIRLGKLAMGLSNQTSFLRPITQGTIHARAIRRHRGRTTWVWEVEMSDDLGHLCVLTRMTVAVRDAPAPAQ